MKNLNDAFFQYNEEKRLRKNTYDEMKEKIETITSEIKKDDDTLSFNTIYLGSFATKTGVDYSNNEYDIDVGIRLNIKDVELHDYSANEEKNKVYEAIKKHREKKFKKMCISAIYYDNNKPKYHLDFPIYAYDMKNDIYYLAKGHKDDVEWENCEPQKLINYLQFNDSNDDNKHTYRRTIRYLKLWKSKVFSSYLKDSCPPSIAINLTARNIFSNVEKKDEIDHLIDVAQNLKRQIRSDIVNLKLPFKPFSDIFYKMNSDIKCINIYRSQIDDLISKLSKAKEASEVSLEEACKILRTIFPDFPLPEKQKTDESFSPTGSYGSKVY